MDGVVKHFPGHGDTGTDSHTSLPVVRKSVELGERAQRLRPDAARREGRDARAVRRAGAAWAFARDDPGRTTDALISAGATGAF